jgi:hypothetical protein
VNDLSADELQPPILTKSNNNKRKKSDMVRIKSKQQKHTGDTSGRNARYCGNCRSIDHDARTCPMSSGHSDQTKNDYILQQQQLQSLELSANSNIFYPQLPAENLFSPTLSKQQQQQLPECGYLPTEVSYSSSSSSVSSRSGLTLRLKLAKN